MFRRPTADELARMERVDDQVRVFARVLAEIVPPGGALNTLVGHLQALRGCAALAILMARPTGPAETGAAAAEGATADDGVKLTASPE